MVTSALHDAVASIVHAALPAEAGLSPADVADLIEVPRDAKLGDLAFPCFRLAKALRKGPPQIATTLAAALPRGLVAEATAAGPYLNLRLDLGRAAAVVLPELAAGLPEPSRTRDEKVMVEYSQPNTHKAFHVGHMRNLSLGDALVRLLRTEGYEVIAANYLGDVGTHIAKCLWWYLDVLDDAQREPPAVARGEWLGELYSAASNRLAALEERAAGDAAAAAELAAAKARTTEILQKLEARDPDMTSVWQQTRAWSIDEFDEIYRWSLVEFDRVFCESEVDEPSHRIVDEFAAKGVFVASDGAIGIFNEEVKHMPFFMLRKRDGTSLYATKDLALARLKFEEYGVDRSIYVVDSRQSDHFRHVFLTLHKMGFPQADRCEHVGYEMVELPEGPMSTRTGTVILFRALRERMLAHLKAQYLDKYRGEWPDAEIDEAAHFLALGAIKYGMLSRDVNQKIVFDFAAWLELEGNTGPYIQYSAARLGSILRKGQERGKTLDASVLGAPENITTALEQPEERELVLALAGLRQAVQQSAQALRPSTLCTYLHNLAKAVNRFSTSKNCRVIQSEGALLQARLLLVAAAHGALRWGLMRIGIPAPTRM